MDLIIRGIDEVLELVVPSAKEKDPDPGDEGAMKEEEMPWGWGCLTEERLEGETSAAAAVQTACTTG